MELGNSKPVNQHHFIGSVLVNFKKKKKKKLSWMPTPVVFQVVKLGICTPKWVRQVMSKSISRPS